MSDPNHYESTWVRVRNTTDCSYCGRKKGRRCVSKNGLEMEQLHSARQMAAIQEHSV